MRTEHAFLLALSAFIGLLFVLPYEFISSGLGGITLTITTFLFGMIAGFYIVVTTTDYNNVKNILAEETAGWIALYKHARLHDEAAAEKIKELIDRYVIKSFDYEIIDYAHSARDEFDAVMRAVHVLSSGDERPWISQNIQEIVTDLVKTRQRLTVLGTKTLSVFEWLVLYILGGLVIGSLYGLRTGEFFFEVVVVAVSCAVVLIFCLVRDLDLYRWNERTFGFDIFQNVLKQIGNLPYYPQESISNGRVHPHEKEYRIGTLTGGSDFERKIETRSVVS